MGESQPILYRTTKLSPVVQPILLDLVTLGSFTDPPTQGDGGPLSLVDVVVSPPTAGVSPDPIGDNLVVYPCTIHHKGRLGGLYTLFAESAQARLEWKAKLEEAIRLRKIAQESNKVFEVKTLSMDTFFSPALPASTGLSWSADRNFTGKVTCSAAFGNHPAHLYVPCFDSFGVTATPDSRDMVAIGCAEGVWIGSRHDSRCMRLLHFYCDPFLFQEFF